MLLDWEINCKLLKEMATWKRTMWSLTLAWHQNHKGSYQFLLKLATTRPTDTSSHSHVEGPVHWRLATRTTSHSDKCITCSFHESCVAQVHCVASACWLLNHQVTTCQFAATYCKKMDGSLHRCKFTWPLANGVVDNRQPFSSLQTRHSLLIADQ